LHQVCECQLAASLISTGLQLQVDYNVNKPAALVDNLQQVGKIRNLQQVCGVSGCVKPFVVFLILFSCSIARNKEDRMRL
jgi:hypothetical protein